MPVGGEQGGEAVALSVGEQVLAGVQGPPGPVERVVLVAAVAVQVLLDPAAAPVQGVAGQARDVEWVHHRDGVPTALTELRRLGRTLNQRAPDVLAYFDRPGTSNGPTEALNGRLEHLRGSALGFRNLTHYIARSLLEAGGFRPQLHPHS